MRQRKGAAEFRAGGDGDQRNFATRTTRKRFVCRRSRASVDPPIEVTILGPRLSQYYRSSKKSERMELVLERIEQGLGRAEVHLYPLA